jgi:hypothetical protein
METRTEIIFVPKISTETLSPEDAARLLVLAHEGYLMDPYMLNQQGSASVGSPDEGQNQAAAGSS